jgi:cysteine desulfurase family protein (TIGR01976 family)
MIDPSLVRPHFPALQRTGADGRPPTFFDNPAGTQICQEALARMRDYLVQSNANHGGAFRASRASDAMVRQTREALAAFLGAARPEEISFGQNMTSLTLHLSRSIARELSPGDEVVVTRLDHDANVAPWLLVARDRGCLVRWVDFDPADCTWSIEALARAVTSRTRLVAVGCASNATGTINPVAEAAEIAHRAGAWCFVDAVHVAPHGSIDVAGLGCDFLACSAYKFFGPHTGILWGRYELMERLSAYKVRPAGDEPPEKWETGTQSFESIAGVLGAVEYLQWVGRAFGGAPAGVPAAAALRAAMEAIRECEAGLGLAMLEGLSSIGGLRLYGITDPGELHRRVPTFAFTLEGWHPRRICEELDREGIAAWDGHYYAVEVTARLGLDASGGMVRVGAVHYNTMDEVDRLVRAVRAIAVRRP